MIRLKTIFTWDNYHYYALLLILSILSIHFWYILFLGIPTLYYLRKKLNLIILSIIIICYFMMFYLYLPIEKEIDKNLLIVERVTHETYYTYYVKDTFKTYEFNHKLPFNIGDTLYVKGQIKNFRKQTIPSGFDSYYYNLGKHVSGKVELSHLSYVSSNSFYHIKMIDNPLIKLIKDVDIIDMSVYGFLFTLSSIHLTFLVLIIEKVLYYLDINNKEKYLILSIILGTFYFIGQSFLVLRLLLIYLLRYINIIFNLSLDAFNIEVLGLIIILILRPLSIYSESFILIYLIIFMNRLKLNHSFISNLLFIPLIMLPFLISFQNQIDITMIFLMPLITLLLKYIYTPLILLVTLLPFLDLLLPFSISFEVFFNFIFQYSLKFYLPHITGIYLIFYLGLLIYIDIAHNQKQYILRLLSLLFLLCIAFIYTLKPNIDQVIFLDVGQGDGSVIFKNNHVIVVDAYNSITNYLETRFVHTIDYLILTHTDLDHIKEAEDLISRFNVETLVLSGYQNYELMHPNIMYITKNYLPYIEDIELQFLGPLKNYYDPNSNSIVFNIKVYDDTFLYTGDIGVDVEKDLVDRYQTKLKSDVLKIAHHGSNTSSSEIFIMMVKPNIGIISVGYKNMYQLPHDEIVRRYERYGVRLYLTSEDGSILIVNQNYTLFPP